MTDKPTDLFRVLLAFMAEAGPEDDMTSEWLRAMALTAEIVKRDPDPIVRSDIAAVYRHLNDDLEDILHGRVCFTAGDSRPFVVRTVHCRRRMRAVTNIAEFGPEWWESPVGGAYWEANLQALARGVEIIRVFIATDRTDPGLLTILAEQRTAGVDVLVLDRAAVPEELHVNLVVWDESYAWEGRWDRSAGSGGTSFITAPRR